MKEEASTPPVTAANEYYACVTNYMFDKYLESTNFLFAHYHPSKIL